MELETKRLKLREFVADDWRDVLAYQSDPRYARFYEWDARSAEDAQCFVQMFLDDQKAQPRIKFQLAVTLKSTAKFIGSCGLRLDAADATEGDLGYELAPDHWGMGYATEAARAMVAFGFETLKLHRIWSWCIAENVGSARVLEKLEMRQEGRLRHKEFFKGRWWDHLLFGLLKDEWLARHPNKPAG